MKSTSLFRRPPDGQNPSSLFRLAETAQAQINEAIRLGDAFAATLSDSGSQLMQLTECVAKPLGSLLSQNGQMSNRWIALHVLENSAVRRRMRTVILDWVTTKGIYRDVSDLSDVTGSGMGVLLAGGLVHSGESPAALTEFLRTCLRDSFVRTVSPSDVTAAAMFLSPEILQALKPYSGDGPLNDLIVTSLWAANMDCGLASAEFPAVGLADAWVAVRAFRGRRRHWARRRGIAAGRAGVRELDASLLSGEGRMPTGLAAMLVEWTLAAIRSWPDREQLVAEDSSEIKDRAHQLVAKAKDHLKNGTNEALSHWLDTGSQALVTTPIAERRLRLIQQ